MARHKGNSNRGRKGGRGSNSQSHTSGNKEQLRPEGNALQIALIAGPAFREAVQSKECPAEELDPQVSSSGPGQRYRLEDWSKVERFLSWFQDGAAKDPSAHLVFSSELAKEHRAELHSLAESLHLESVSQGVGDRRHIALYRQGCAPSKAQLSEDVKEKSKLLYDMAKVRGVALTRDEAAEMFVNESFSAEAQELWNKEGELQLAIRGLNHAASKGQLDQLKALIELHPGAAKGSTKEISSGLTPLNCAAAQGHTACASALLDAGALLEATDSFGMTPLGASRKFEQMDMEALLLRAGAKDGNAEFEQAVDVAESDSQDTRPKETEPDGPAPTFAASQSAHSRSASGSEPIARTAKSSFEGFPGPPIRGNIGEDPEEGPSAVPEEQPATQMDPQQFPGGWTEPSQPPVVAQKVPKNVPAVVGGRSMSGKTRSGNLPEGLSREYTGSPNLKDPRAATRGMPGASALALGRRIIENAAAEMTRYGSAGLSGDLDKFPYTEPSQPPAVPSGKLSGIPNVVGGRGTAHQVDSGKVQMAKPRGLRLQGNRNEPSQKTNRSRVEAWMESAPEEHSSLGSSNHQSSPDLQQLVSEIEAAKRAVSEDLSGMERKKTGRSAGKLDDALEGSDKAEDPEASRKLEPREASGEVENEDASGKSEDEKPSRTAENEGTSRTAGNVEASGTAEKKEASQSRDNGGSGPQTREQPASPAEVAEQETSPSTPAPDLKVSEEKEATGGEPKLRYQDPRGVVVPTQPPVASSGLFKGSGGAGETAHHSSLEDQQEPTSASLQADRGSVSPTTEVSERDLTSLPGSSKSLPIVSSVEKMLDSRQAAPYAEGTQPPGLAVRSISQVPAIVGGQGVSMNKEAANGPGGRADGIQMDARLATYGQKGPSATDLGRRVIEDPAKQMDRHGSAGRSGNLDTALYVEPSQPPLSPGGKLTGIPGVVGGKRVNKKVDEYSSEAARAAQEAEQALLTEQSSSPQKEDEAVEDMGGAGFRVPSFEFPRNAESLLVSSTTAEAMSRPKGLGRTQGLPAKRPTTAKLSKSKSGDMARTLSTEAVAGSPRGSEYEGGEKLYGALKDGLSSSLEKLSSVSSSVTEKLRADEPSSWLHTGGQWVADHHILVASGALAGTAAIAGLYWLKLRR